MNIQIFGTKKCNETKKAERFFKERGIKYQFVDMKKKGMKQDSQTLALKENGIIYTLFKYCEFEGERNGRYRNASIHNRNKQ